MIKGAMQLEEINKKKQLDDDEVIGVVAKQIKMRRESIVDFEKGNRTDLIEEANREIEILNEYMPEQLSEEEVNQIIEEAFNEIQPKENKDMGKIMGFVTPKLKGKADMSNVSKIIKEKLNKQLGNN
jgi:hypothetical protein